MINGKKHTFNHTTVIGNETSEMEDIRFLPKSFRDFWNFQLRISSIIFTNYFKRPPSSPLQLIWRTLGWKLKYTERRPFLPGKSFFTLRWRSKIHRQESSIHEEKWGRTGRRWCRAVFKTQTLLYRIRCRRWRRRTVSFSSGSGFGGRKCKRWFGSEMGKTQKTKRRKAQADQYFRNVAGR